MTGFIQSIITIVAFILILGGLVIIHELGHFVTARLAKVKVLEFGIGFPPRAKVLRSKGETLYTLNWLPIGGFVKLEGEDGNDADDPRSFAAQRYLTKMLILVAGVAMNIVLAFAIFTAIAWLASPLVGVRFFEVQPGSPAAAAGLQAGDAIVAVDGERYQFIAGTTALTGLRDRAGETVVLTIDDRAGARRDVAVTLRSEAEINAEQGALGISGATKPFEAYFRASTRQHDLPSAVQIGVSETVRWMGLIVGGLASLVGSVVADPDGAATRRRPGRHRHADRRHPLEQRPDHDALRRGHPVGQPRRREHPAVPAARWRPDADDHAQAALRARGSACVPSR